MRKTIIEKIEKKRGVSTLKYSYTTGGDYHNNQSSMRHMRSSMQQSRPSAQKKQLSDDTKSSNSKNLTSINNQIEKFTDKLKDLFSKKHRMQKLQNLQMSAVSTLSRFAKATLTQRKYADNVTKARIIDEEQKRTSEQQIVDVNNEIDFVQETLEELYRIKDELTQNLGSFISTTIMQPSSTTSRRQVPIMQSSSTSMRQVPIMQPSSTTSRRQVPSMLPSSSTIRQQSIDNSELMMNNLRAILTILTEVWGSTIKYEQEKNNVVVNLNIYRFNFKFKNINSIKEMFTKNYNSIYSACSWICSEEIKDLNKKLNNSSNDKDTYNTIIELLRQYIKENINKSGLKPNDKKDLETIQTKINSLEQIRGGKLRKVRKTNVIKKRTTRVIRNKKL